MQNLNDGGQESLRALIQAIAPEITSRSNGNTSGDVVDRLTANLNELVGPEAVEEYNRSRNERGESVNEEGLPIIEISEPGDGGNISSMASLPTPITVEPLIPLGSLSSPVQARLREKRNRILDLLEEEERQAELQEKQREQQEREELMRKRKDDAGKERDRLKEAKELQKKMGRALLHNMNKAKEKERQEQETQRLRDEEADRRKSLSTKKKTVAFAETTEDFEKEPKVEASEGLDWGDVTPARLRNTKRPTLMSQALLDKHPMKMAVVERVPGGQATITKSSQLPRQTLDSDDDFESKSSDTEAEEPILETDEVDIDFAQHQREIALEYYKKRGTIGQAAAAAMKNHSHDLDAHMDGATDIMQESSKPAVSQFRASRIASAYNIATPISSESPTSLGDSVLPSSSTRTIQRAIRTGKLDSDGKLVGGEADSASEEDQDIQEVLELLRKGEVYNIGPNGEYLHTIPASATTAPIPGASTSTLQAAELRPNSALPPPSMRSKKSKFKALRSSAGRPSSSSTPISSIPNVSNSELISPCVTPISHAGRSSPKMDTPAVMTSAVGERTPTAESSNRVFSPSPGKAPVRNPPSFSMMVDSPSFPSRQELSNTSTMPPMVISSPSFPPPQSSRRPERPPTVISSSVRENTSPPARQPSLAEAVSPELRPEKKVSRFKAERT